jgi:hypothetical protein
MGIAGAVGVQWELPGAVARRGRGRVREHDQARLRPRRRSVGRENGHPAASRMDRRLQQNRSPLFSRNAFPKGVSCPQPSDFMCLEIWGAEQSANGSSATNSNPGTPTGDLSPLLTTTGLLMEVRCNEGRGDEKVRTELLDVVA